MRRLFVVLTLAVVVVGSASIADAKLPVLAYGQVGYGKLMEDNAPNGSIGFGAGIIYKVPSKPVVGLGAEVSYVMVGKQDETVGDGDVGVTGEISLSMIPITGQAYYLVPTEGTTDPYVTGGFGVYMSRAKVKVSADLGQFGSYSTEETDSSSDFGFNLGGGVIFGKDDAKLGFGADARYHIVMTDDESTSLITLFGRIYFQ